MQCDAPCCANRATQQLLVDAQPLARVCSERCGHALLDAIGMPRRPYSEDDDDDIQAVKRIPAASAAPSAETRAQMLALLPLARKPASSSSSSARPPPAASSSSSSSAARPPPAAASSSSSSSARPTSYAAASSSSASSSSSSARPAPPAAASSSSSSAAAAASSSSSSAATVAPLPPAAAVAADEREPVARTLLQVNGITPAIAAKLGFTVYRLLEAGDSEPAMRALLAPAFDDDDDMHYLLARAPVGRNDALDVATQHALSWVRIHRDRVARWRAAHPGRALPDPVRPSGWLQDVPGLNPKLLNAPENARRLGIGTTDALRAFYRANGPAATRLRLTEAGYVHGKQKVDLLAALAYVSWLP